MSTVTETTDTTAIKVVWQEYEAAIEAGDIDRWLELWIPEGKQMPPGVPSRHGLKQIREGNLPLMELFDVEIAISPEVIQIVGDVAYSHGDYTYALTPKEGGDRVKTPGKFLTILNRQPDNSWKIAVDCFNDSVATASY